MAGIVYINRGEYGTGVQVVPPGQFFMLGDNSPNSRDSRYWGFVPVEDVIGKVIFVYRRGQGLQKL